jgi:hypothetical protein
MTRHVLDALAVVDLDAPEPTVAAPYSARPVIKALYWPLRRWDAQRGVWVVKAAGIRTLIAALRDAGYNVDVWSGGQMRTLGATSGRRRP